MEPTKKAKVFTDKNIEEFLSAKFDDDSNKAFWILRQSIFAVGVCGGLRTSELHSLRIEDAEETPYGFLFTFTGAKQRGGRKEQSHFLVPFESENPDASPGKILKT